MDGLFGESSPNFDWENFVDYDNNGNDIFAANYEDINLFPPLDLLSAPKANAEEVNSNEQASSLPEGNHGAADHSQPSSQGSQSLEYQVQTLVLKVQEVKQMLQENSRQIDQISHHLAALYPFLDAIRSTLKDLTEQSSRQMVLKTPKTPFPKHERQGRAEAAQGRIERK